MLRIDSDQMSAIEAGHRAGEPAWAAARLKTLRPDWCATRSDEALHQFCTETLAFARACAFEQRSSFEQLLLWRADARLPSPFSEWHKLLLTRPGFDEATRLQQFEQALDSPQQPVLIALDTDLAALRRAPAPRAESGARP